MSNYNNARKRRSKTPRPTSSMVVLRQLCNLIPCGMVQKIAIETGVEKLCRTFGAWSHVVALLYAQVSHSIGLNDVCDALGIHSGPLGSIRGATAPPRNTLSRANRERSAEMAEMLFWRMFSHLESLCPSFVAGGGGKGAARRFRRTIHVVDSTTLQLVANCIDWAKHRRRKAAAKCHLRLNLQNFLPSFVLIGSAKDNDAARAREVCAGVLDGEIVVFDRAYVDFDHLFDFYLRGVIWVTRAKENLKLRVVRNRRITNPKILADQEVRLSRKNAYLKKYPTTFRRVRALVVIDGEEREMEFLTNNMEWSPASVADLYRNRWSIEVFFKQLKQTLQLADFLGHNANAVRWQVWMALLVYLLMRFQAHVSRWGHSFARLVALVRSALWVRLDLRSLLDSYGTAGGSIRSLACPQQAYFPSFAR